MKPKVRRKEISQKAGKKEMEEGLKRQQKRSTKPTGGSKGNLSKLTNLQLDTPKEDERTQINKIRNQRGDITTNTTEIQRILRDYYEQIYTNKLDNL